MAAPGLRPGLGTVYAPGVLRQTWKLYLETRKETENYWAKYFTRPFAAFLVLIVRGTPVTPNQVTILAFLTACAGAATMVLWRDWVGLLVAVSIYQLAYVLDCVDGMLARVRGTSSRIGHLFDFLLDEIKAVGLYGAVTLRLWLMEELDLYVLVGIPLLVALAAGLSLTTFTRRPEYTGPVAPAAPAAKKSILRRILGLPMAVARFIVNYPAYLVWLALVDRIDLYFWAYGATVALYALKTFAGAALKLGRPAPKTGE